MKPILEKIPSSTLYSYSTEYIEETAWKSKWHYHEKQVEIILILEGTGTGFIGDGTVFFSGDELAIIGSKVPHVWLNDKIYYEKGSKLRANAIVVKFDESFLGDRFLLLPGIFRVRELILNRSKRGMMILGNTMKKCARLIKKILKTHSDFERIILLIEILNLIANSSEFTYVSKFESVKIPRSSDIERLEKVIKYVSENFQEKIELEKVAGLANMTPSSFCKYFKKRTLKTFTQFLNEVRIGNACRLLTEKDMSVKQVCYMSGFNYLSNFYKQFHAIHQLSPLEYKEKLYESRFNTGL